MLKGIPYWGDTTFSDINTVCSITNIQNFCDPACLGILADTSIYDIFRILSHSNMIFLVPHEDKYFVSWCFDIRFDYRDHVIFIPYFEYTQTVVNSKQKHKHLYSIDSSKLAIHHSFRLHAYPVFVSYNNFMQDHLLVADTKTLQIYKISLKGRRWLSADFSLAELYTRYCDASYYDEDWERVTFRNKYHWIFPDGDLNTEAAIRSSYRLPTTWDRGRKLGTPEMIRLWEYPDIRRYPLQIFTNVYHFDIHTDLLFWERRFNFDAYLFCCIEANLEPVELEYRDKWKSLGTTERFFRYDDIFPMYLKHYYKKHTDLSQATYERYLIIKSEKEVLTY